MYNCFRLGPGVKSYVKRKKQMMQKQTNVSDQHRRQRKRNAANARKSTNSFSAALLVQGADAASSYQQFRLRYQRMLSSERKRKLQGVGRRKQTNPIRLSPGELFIFNYYFDWMLLRNLNGKDNGQ